MLIRTADEKDIHLWAYRLGCSVERLRAAIKLAGPMAANVRQYLRTGW